ncbi:MAG: hypothetical protein OJF58_001753 [Enhydrobacter sp.]|nr:MAG: hypothetical protein OJF58_001753 [Enhydrobacter sp.]
MRCSHVRVVPSVAPALSEAGGRDLWLTPIKDPSLRSG